MIESGLVEVPLDVVGGKEVILGRGVIRLRDDDALGDRGVVLGVRPLLLLPAGGGLGGFLAGGGTGRG
ncbi:hypothetical protein Asp14428_43360 [Actinoplanes sp. NBRC 14428]|nr:hypothetical protein Asp14428_43360 [Actinoplanes sp. NBRC 14428]